MGIKFRGFEGLSHRKVLGSLNYPLSEVVPEPVEGFSKTTIKRSPKTRCLRPSKAALKQQKGSSPGVTGCV